MDNTISSRSKFCAQLQSALQQDVQFANKNYTDNDVERTIIPNLIKRGKSLENETVQLFGNQITAEGLRLLLKQVPHIRKLDISDNPIGNDGALILAHSHLQDIKIMNCGLNFAGALYFLKSSSIESLMISEEDNSPDWIHWRENLDAVMRQNELNNRKS